MENWFLEVAQNSSNADVILYVFIFCIAQGSPGGDLETIARECFRAFDGANQEARRDIAKLLGTLVAYTQQVKQSREMLMHWKGSSKI